MQEQSPTQLLPLGKSSSHSRHSDGFESSHDGQESDAGSSVAGAANQPPAIGRREDRRVAMSRLLMLTVLAVAAAGTAWFTYWFTHRVELNDFDTRFNDFARQVIEVSKINTRHILESYENIGLQITSYAMDTPGVEWPTFHVPQFAAQMQHVMDDTGATLTTFVPFVTEDKKEDWEAFHINNTDWIYDAHQFENKTFNPNAPFQDVSPTIYGSNRSAESYGPTENPFYAPIMQTAPFTKVYAVQLLAYDYFEYATFPRVLEKVREKGVGVLSQVTSFRNGREPSSFMASPIFERTFGNREDKAEVPIKGVLTASLPWKSHFDNLLPDGIDGMLLVVENECNQTFSYEINGPVVHYLGEGDKHDPAFDKKRVQEEFGSFETVCKHTLNVYPSRSFEKRYLSNNPIYFTVAVLGIFILTGIVFVIYDFVVEKRQTTVVTSATRANAVVNSLFPVQVRDRLMDDRAGGNARIDKKSTGFDPTFSAKLNLVMSDDETQDGDDGQYAFGSKPIADLFPSCTVMFADICGFTAWSSSRSPTQVFSLLETVYSAFDRIARRLKVFKVETIGDCYVAVAGLPEPREDHAVAMCRFSRDCMNKMSNLLPSLELSLGPDTADLSMRFGLHSGPVTGGVLRGEKSRFQLFGDTVNTASRMESTGQKNRIQVSQETADHLEQSGKSRWMQPREGIVEAKGKGAMQTYWVSFGTGSVATTDTLKSDGAHYIEGNGSHNEECEETSTTSSGSPSRAVLAPSSSKDTERRRRMIEWNVSLLEELLKKIISMRIRYSSVASSSGPISNIHTMESRGDQTILQEVQEIIKLPRQPAKIIKSPDSVELPPLVSKQLLDYVTQIADIYHNNSFHSFEHASHVTMSAVKLLSRVVAPSTALESNDVSTAAATPSCSKKEQARMMAKKQHLFTYGITSDPLTQFAVVFSALIHDVDHVGIPNTRLAKESPHLAELYKHQSIAEQNSVDLSWSLLMGNEFAELRACIYNNQSELDRFRQLVVNSVMATDIIDKDLGALRKARWEKAFAASSTSGSSMSGDTDESTSSSDVDDVNRKATIVIEHLIQASDVSHTMQHWHVYIKWNERLFLEMYDAYVAGRADKNPAEGWYEGELGFFDFYIIPLARKLKECNVFGVASDEYLNYAVRNRAEWEAKGRKVVGEYLEKCKGKNQRA